MIGYVTLGTNDIARAAAFYDKLLEPIGGQRGMAGDDWISWGNSETGPGLAVIKPFNKQAATVGNGTMVSLAATSRAQVDAVHAKALALGGADEGAPGIRGGDDSNFYAAYFRDLDGNKLAVFTMGR